MDLEIKKEIRREFLEEWVKSSSVDEIVNMLVLNDERAKKIEKALFYIDMDKHISCNWDIMSNQEKDDYILGLLNELERILGNE